MPPNWRPGLDEATRRTVTESGRLLPISPRGGLYLVLVSYFATERTGLAAYHDMLARETHERFARVFRKAWFRVPRRARMRLLRYWRCEAWPLHSAPFAPRVALLLDWPGRPWSFQTITVGNHNFGCDLWFWSLALNQMPDELAATTIAAVLASALYFVHRHVDMRKHGIPKPRNRADWIVMTDAERHRTAPGGITSRRWVRRWGFDWDAVERFVQEAKDLGGIDLRVRQRFRYPPPVDIPVDMAQYAKMKPSPVLPSRPLPGFVE